MSFSSIQPSPIERRDYNAVRRVNRTGGWRGAMRTARQDFEHEIERLNRDGYRVLFIVPDQWNLWQWLRSVLVTLVTLGIRAPTRGYLIIGERVH